MTEIGARRWRQFKKNRRGFIALWIFLSLFVMTMAAEWLANDRPLVIYHQEKLYWPIWNDYFETDFGGDFATVVDYRDPFVEALIQKDGWMIWPPIHYRFDTINYELTVPAPSPPTTENWLGTDDQGRDVLARVIYGFRVSVLFGLFLTVFSSVIGIFLGALQGYFGGWADLMGQRVIEIWSGLPVLFLIIVLSSVVEPNFWWLLLILLLFSWMNLVGVVRAEFLRGRKLDYVRAAKALGVTPPLIMFRHILPNAMIATLTFIPFVMSSSIVTLTSLDFLGFGLPPDSASLGELLAQGKNNLNAPWLGITAFMVLAVTLTLLIFIGEAVRDAFNPRKGV